MFAEQESNLEGFMCLMQRTDDLLNRKAQENPDYFRTRGGSLLEDDVLDALNECAEGTPFAGTILKVSGQKFPDIVVSRRYGVEVKSTKEDHWFSTGSSILETTRVPGVDVIYLTFGKLGGERVMFKSRLYEECLSGIAVTHMPRYLIDMRLGKGDTIFDSMHLPYNKLRNMDNPISPVARYYRSKLKSGESLWWTGDSSDESVSAKIRLWGNLSKEEKSEYTIYACVNFPEVLAGNYDRYALWLTSQGVVDSHLRDQFSAGGQEEMLRLSGDKVKFPGVYRRIKDNLNAFLGRMKQVDPSKLVADGNIGQDELEVRLRKWAESVSRKSREGYDVTMDVLRNLFRGVNAS